MQLLSQSAFLQALGYAIAGSLWQAALLWLVVAGINGVFKLSSQVKYKIALTAQFGAFVWFLVSLQFYYTKCSEAIALLKYSGLNTGNAFILQPGTSTFSSAILTTVQKGEKLLPYLSLAYLCLLVILAIRWINGYRQTKLIKTTGLQKIDVEWRLFVKKISGLLNIKHTVGIYVSELVKSPLTIGFLKPLILIPVASINNLTTYQLEAIILHELAHIKRADYFINIILSIIEISLFFNPFIQLLGKITKRERENSCDDWVLQFQYDASTYAEALLRIAYMQQAPAFAMNAAGKENDLLWRVKRMLNQKEKTFQYRNRLLALLLITGLLSSVAWFTPGVNASTVKPTTAQKGNPVVMEPLTAKVDNPLFNPLSFLNKPFKEEVSRAVENASSDLVRESINLAGTALNNIAPAVENIKTTNGALPVVLTQAGNIAGDAVNAVFTSLGNDKLNTVIAQYTDSGFVKNVWQNTAAEFNKIDLAKIKTEITAATKQAAKELEGKDMFAGLKNVKWQDLVAKSLKEAQEAKYEVVLDDAKDHVKTLNYTKAQNQAVHILKLQSAKDIKKVTDSLVRVYGRLSHRANNRGDVPADASIQYYNAAAMNNYMAPQAGTYIPAKFEIPNSESWSNGSGVSVSTTNNSRLIAVKEEKDTNDSYRKNLTIETMDSLGQRHTFHVTVEVYQ